jgi:hypothetical protein
MIATAQTNAFTSKGIVITISITTRTCISCEYFYGFGEAVAQIKTKTRTIGIFIRNISEEKRVGMPVVDGSKYLEPEALGG